MKKKDLQRLDRALNDFLDELTDDMGRPERRSAMRNYVTGLLLDGERKSIQPMAARLVEDPNEAEAMRQRLQQCVVVSGWSDEEARRRLCLMVADRLPGIEAYVIDDTGFPKKGKHSVGVARQYSGTLGRIDNCQVAVSTHIASGDSSCCVEMDLYLSKEWTDDPARRNKVGVPDEVVFREKWRTALSQLDRIFARGHEHWPVLADAGYGDSVAFRQGLRDRGCQYVVGLSDNNRFWPPDASPEVPAKKTGRPATRYQDEKHPPASPKGLALELGRDATRTVTWGQGSKGPKRSRFGAARVRSAHYRMKGATPGEEEWLLWEWPRDKAEPTKFWLSTLPKQTSLKRLVHMAKLRWRVERDYQEMKKEIGLDHFEGRTWRGFHHHVTLCMAAHAFLALYRGLFPPIK